MEMRTPCPEINFNWIYLYVRLNIHNCHDSYTQINLLGLTLVVIHETEHQHSTEQNSTELVGLSSSMIRQIFRSHHSDPDNSASLAACMCGIPNAIRVHPICTPYMIYLHLYKACHSHPRRLELNVVWDRRTSTSILTSVYETFIFNTYYINSSLVEIVSRDDLHISEFDFKICYRDCGDLPPTPPYLAPDITSHQNQRQESDTLPVLSPQSPEPPANWSSAAEESLQVYLGVK